MSGVHGWISVIGEATGQYGGRKKYGVEKDRGEIRCFEMSDHWIDKRSKWLASERE